MKPTATIYNYRALMAAELEYMRVAEAITDRITSGDLAAGARLPAEKDIAAEFGVAYHTVRRALIVLRDRGLVETLWGKGTFVTRDAPAGGAPRQP